MGVIDYSLLMGIDTVDRNLVIGLVDYCRCASHMGPMY